MIEVRPAHAEDQPWSMPHASDHVQVGLVAELDGAVVGHVQLNQSWVDSRQALVDVLVLSPLSVDPAYQRLLRAWIRPGQQARFRPAVGADPRPRLPGGAAGGRTRSG